MNVSDDIKAMLLIILRNQCLILNRLDKIDAFQNDIHPDDMNDPRWLAHQAKVDDLEIRSVNAKLTGYLSEIKVTKHELNKYDL